MSGDDYFLGDYEDEWEPYSVADELAERTIQSPVVFSLSAALDLFDWDDEEPDSEDDYDDFTPLNEVKINEHTKQTRKTKQGDGHRGPGADRAKSLLARRPVLWKSRGERDRTPELPMKGDEQLRAVSLLKDWRQHLQRRSVSPNGMEGQTARRSRVGPPSGQSPTAIHDYEGDGDLSATEDTEHTELPPTSIDRITNEPKAPTKPPTFMNGTTSSLAKQAMMQASSNNATGDSTLRKRKATDQAEESLQEKGEPRKKQWKGIKASESKVVEVKIDQKPNVERKVKAAEKTGQKRGRSKRAENAGGETRTLASTRSTRSRKK